MYQIVFSKKAIKSLREIPVEYQVKVKNTANKLSSNPFDLDIRKISPYYQATHRLRVGSYRIFLKINLEAKTIEILEVVRRTTQTYN